MQTQSITLHIGVDIGKHEIVAACAEGEFGVRKIRNPHGA